VLQTRVGIELRSSTSSKDTNSTCKVTMDIYAKAKYNKPEELSSVVNSALKKPSKSESGAKTGQ